MPGKGKKGSKGRKRSKGRKVAKPRMPRKGKQQTVTEVARAFLYECSGGMDENKKRDEFLAKAKKLDRGRATRSVIENVLRAALFQGQAWERGNPAMRKRKHVSGAKNDQICFAAREHLYECPGGMDTNETRDKFLASAARDEKAMGRASLYSTIGNIVRAAYHQGLMVGREHVDADPQPRASKVRKVRRKKQGPLDAGDRHVLRILVEEIGVGIAERLGVTADDQDEHVTILMEHLSTLTDRFDCTGKEPGLWKVELQQIAHDILDRVLERTQEKLQVIMGASAWQTMGLPQF